MTIQTITQLAAVLLTGLIAGLFYGYDCSVIKGLGNLPDKEYLGAFQSINRAILNPYFFLSFAGSLIILPVACWLSFRSGNGASSYLLLAATLTYLFGVFIVTAAANVPLNDILDKFNLSTETPAAIQAFRENLNPGGINGSISERMHPFLLFINPSVIYKKIMKHLVMAVVLLTLSGIIISCSKKVYTNNGENIYRTGKNLQGEKLLDKKNSQITIFKSCAGCHGKTGARMKACDIRWSYLSDPGKITVPYTEDLFARFLDKDLKSDGTPARTGVHWAMSQADKTDLLNYLKTLK